MPPGELELTNRLRGVAPFSAVARLATPPDRADRTSELMTLLRYGIVGILVALVAPAVAVGVMAVGLSAGVAGVIAAVLTVFCGWRIAPWLPLQLGDGSGRGRAVFLAWVAVGLFAAYRLAGLGIYMHEVERSEYAFRPTIRELDDAELAKPFFPKHNCFTCYIVAAHVAGERVENLYDRKFYRDAEVKTPIHHQIGESLHVDSYQYPPPFLIFPRLLMATGGDFYQLRAYWFAINIVVFVGTVLTLVLWMSGGRFTLHWFALPVLLASPIMLGSLQIQNVHVLMIAISLLALPAFDKEWHWLGGGLLGFAIVSKLFPGLLLVFLLLQRRWRAVWWTCGWMGAYCVLTYVIYGPAPFEAFLSYQMPRLANGEAFGFATKYIAAMLKNGSILGIAYKAEALGIISEPARVASILVGTYTLLLPIVLVVVGRRRYTWGVHGETDDTSKGGRVGLARVWLVLLILGQLRSPFLPWVYGNVPILLLAMLLLPARWNTKGDMFKTLLLVPALVMPSVIIPLPFGPPTVELEFVYTLGTLLVALLCCAVVVVHGRRLGTR